ncbi:MAG: DUF4253 domain-containing protein [Ignavibacteriae bacterium]|nr:DUF4253 domain-containing protein [Ignavibacteriota bacterium]
MKEASQSIPDSTSEIIQSSYSIDPNEWLAKRREEEEEEGFTEDLILGELSEQLLEQLLAETQDISVSSLKQRTYKGLSTGTEVLIGLVSIEEPWHLPAILKYGDWNDCPHPSVHCALHRKWQSEYGANIIAVTHDTIECVVQKPPMDQEKSLELAWQQYWYCRDIVEQGCKTVALLAASCLKEAFWYFWWD